jgi:uncharacterized protein involved in exopolysaccharide biosynthesis
MSFESNAIDAPRIHYERVAHDTLRMLWKHRSLVAAVLGIALAGLAVMLVFTAPRYTGEAIVQLDFVRNENIAGEKVLSTAAVDAAAVVDSAARIIRSRATASAVVAALGLDHDPAYAHVSLLSRVLTPVRYVFGQPQPTLRENAVTRLMKQITVTNDPRSYLITVAVTTTDPERAARLANWVASEYLRGRLREQAIAAYSIAEKEMATLGSVFGPRHPNYLGGLTKVGHLRAELDAAQKAAAPDAGQQMVWFAAGQSLLPAEPVMVPSGPNVMLLFALTVLVGLAAGIMLSLLAEKGMLERFMPHPATLWTRYGWPH